jgi:transposase
MPLPDFAHVHRELGRPGVTRLLLWQEYKAQHPDGLQYSAFCDHLREHASAREPVMRFEHRAGEKCFVDYAGQCVAIIDQLTGEIRDAQIFVAVLGCSNVSGNWEAFLLNPPRPDPSASDCRRSAASIAAG